MKRLVVLFCYLTIQTIAYAQNVNHVTLSGKLKGFNNQVLIEDMSEFQYLLPPTANRIIVPDTAGNFSITFKLLKPNYFRLGRNQLYLSPGDSLTLFIDQAYPKKSTFKGRGAEANNYLRKTPFPKEASYIEAGTNAKDTPEETLATVEAMAKLRSAELKSIMNVPAEFRRLEEARIKADLINSLIEGEFYSTYRLKLKGEEEKQYNERYQKAISEKVRLYTENFADSSFLKLPVYRDVAYRIVKANGKPEAIEIIKAFLKTQTMVRNMQKQSDKQLLAPFKAEIDQLKIPEYKVAATQMHHHLMAFGKGDPAADFMALDQNGKKINLSSLKGKVIYVDLWATWCGPCMLEMPSYEKLKQKYADNPNVAFVSLSIDDKEDLWKNSLQQRNAAGIQWLISRSKLLDYNIVNIPRSLLIDKDFKMVNMVAPKPSEAAAVREIELLLK